MEPRIVVVRSSDLAEAEKRRILREAFDILFAASSRASSGGAFPPDESESQYGRRVTVRVTERSGAKT
jgi:hypothetical protein